MMKNPASIKGSMPNVPTKDIKDIDVSSKIFEYIPQESAEYYQVVPLGVKDGVLEVGAIDPNNIEARDALNFISSRIGMPYKLFLISKEEIKKESKEVSRETIIEDAPVTKIVATILSYASEGKASDIHIEPMSDKIRVRFRVDGQLNTSLVLPIKVHLAVVARIKILSNMRLDEKRKPQDGRFSAKIGNRKIDFRVSTFPTYYGEKVVMRILDQSQGLRSLDDIGFSETNLKLIRRVLQRPYGLVLITGPTGSGKSTTLYA